MKHRLTDWVRRTAVSLLLKLGAAGDAYAAAQRDLAEVNEANRQLNARYEALYQKLQDALYERDEARDKLAVLVLSGDQERIRFLEGRIVQLTSNEKEFWQLQWDLKDARHTLAVTRGQVTRLRRRLGLPPTKK